MPPFNQSWKSFLGDAYVDRWRRKARALYAQPGQRVYPQQENVFRAFDECPLDCLKVVIVGEEPYENENADGLAFSVSGRARVPPSLCNILSEIHYDLGIAVGHDGNLERWARRGVLLLNSSLTVGQISDSIRWGYFAKKVLKKIYEQRTSVMFMIWGKEANERGRDFVDNHNGHRVLRSSHPSPQSASNTLQIASNTSGSFVDCQHFSRANEWLEERDRPPVNWS